MTHEEKRQKLAFASVSVRHKLTELKPETRQAHQAEIEAYVVALRAWEGGKPGAAYPEPPAFLNLARSKASPPGAFSTAKAKNKKISSKAPMRLGKSPRVAHRLSTDGDSSIDGEVNLYGLRAR